MINSDEINKCQVELFARIQKMLPEKSALVHVVSDLLGIGIDATYRRLRGAKSLSLGETIKLCDHFRISLDSTISSTNEMKIQCEYAPYNFRNLDDYINYVKIINYSLEDFRQMPESEILVSVADVHLFNILSYNELTIFKLFSFQKNMNSFSGGFDDFAKEIPVEELSKSCKNTVKYYNSIPSFEIWTTSALESTLRMIDYHYEMGHFYNSQTPLLICKQLIDMMDKVQIWTEKGTKGEHETPFKLFIIDIDIGNTFLLFRNKERANCFVRLYTINGLNTSDKYFCQEIESLLRNLAKRSTLISNASEKDRHKFFNSQRQKIQVLIAKIQS